MAEDDSNKIPTDDTFTSPTKNKNWLDASTWKRNAYAAAMAQKSRISTTKNSKEPISGDDERNDVKTATNFLLRRDDDDDADGSQAPLDFSLKKRKSTDDETTPADKAGSDRVEGAAELILERRASLSPSPLGSRRSESSAFECVRASIGSHQLFPRPVSVVGEGAQHRNLGAASQPPTSLNEDEKTAALRNGATEVDTRATPIFNATAAVFNSHHHHQQQQQIHQHNGHRSNAQQQKVQRPFKAYNPMDPMSALQIGASLPSTALPFLNAALGSTPSNGNPTAPAVQPILPPQALPALLPPPGQFGVLSPLLNAQLLSQYRQYLFNAQAAAALAALRSKSAQQLQRHNSMDPQLHDSRVDVTTPTYGQQHQAKILASASSQSPPQVTSTSHPHTAESLSSSSSAASPPSPRISNSAFINAAVAAAMASSNGAMAAATAASKKMGRRISSGSASGGSGSGGSFSGADGPHSACEDDEDEDEEELDHSSRVSPTPSCSSSTTTAALAAAIGRNANGDASNVKLQSNGASNGRRKGRSLPEAMKDEAYWERRRKNNEAAKRSRDARRVKEDEIAIRAALLEQENMRLRIEVAALKSETDKLRQMLLNT